MIDDMAGLDSNCLTFLLNALEGIEKPTDALVDQKIALVRLFFYGAPLLTTPTVTTIDLSGGLRTRRTSN